LIKHRTQRVVEAAGLVRIVRQRRPAEQRADDADGATLGDVSHLAEQQVGPTHIATLTLRLQVVAIALAETAIEQAEPVADHGEADQPHEPDAPRLIHQSGSDRLLRPAASGATTASHRHGREPERAINAGLEHVDRAAPPQVDSVLATMAGEELDQSPHHEEGHADGHQPDHGATERMGDQLG
jgi:hypothetical protein